MLGEKEYTCASVNAYVALSGKYFLLAKLGRGVFIIYASCSLPAHLPQRRVLRIYIMLVVAFGPKASCCLLQFNNR